MLELFREINEAYFPRQNGKINSPLLKIKFSFGHSIAPSHINLGGEHV